MKSIAFVIPYFGHFPNYFDKWLISCSYNSTIDWIIFTDCHEEYDYPINVHVNYCTFEDMKVLFQSKFDFKISLNKPYKLCDYKCAYGYIFEKELEKYDFWGYCDVDLIWGNLRQFITDEMLNEYDRVGLYGHCSIIKNKKELKELFMKNVEGVPNYRWVYSSSMSFCFDETYAFNKYFKIYGYSMKEIPYICDINIKYEGFVPAEKDFNLPIGLSTFSYENGCLCCHYKYPDQTECKEEISYVHLQKRNMKVNGTINTKYCIVPNAFVPLGSDVSWAYMDKLLEVNFSYIKFKFKYWVRDILGIHRFYHYQYPWLYKRHFSNR